jgi:hypothetical protein
MCNSDPYRKADNLEQIREMVNRWKPSELDDGVVTLGTFTLHPHTTGFDITPLGQFKCRNCGEEIRPDGD